MVPKRRQLMKYSFPFRAISFFYVLHVAPAALLRRCRRARHRGGRCPRRWPSRRRCSRCRFHRHHAQGVVLAAAGEQLLGRARSLLAHAREIEQDVAGLATEVRGQVSARAFTSFAPLFHALARGRLRQGLSARRCPARPGRAASRCATYPCYAARHTTGKCSLSIGAPIGRITSSNGGDM